MGFRHHTSAPIGKGVGLSFSPSGSGIGISARTPDPTAEPASGDKPALPSPTRPRFSVRPGKGIFAIRRYRRAFRRGLIAFAQGKPEIALQEMERASLKGGAERASVQLFLALCLIDLGRLPEAASRLRALVASDAQLPDRLMHRNLSDGVLETHVTPNITAHTALDRIGASLLLAEVLQRTHRPSEAIDLLEMLGARTRSPVLALCLADLYLAEGAWEDVERVTDAFASNVDDLSLRILIIRARAQRERGVFIPTLTTLREALRFRKRDPSLLNAARYERALLYEAKGKVALARKDLERIFDHGPGFRDVAQRLSGSALTPSDFELDELLPSDAG